MDSSIENELFERMRKRTKRNKMAMTERTEMTDNRSETHIIARNSGRGKKNMEKAVMSASKLAIRNPLGVMVDVKTIVCSYSKTVKPLRVVTSISARSPLTAAEKGSK